VVHSLCQVGPGWARRRTGPRSQGFDCGGGRGGRVTEATRPPPGRRRWGVRSMGQPPGVSAGFVRGTRCHNGIKRAPVRTFKLSNDPKFDEKSWDVIGLYLNPPDRALVLCCDEKSQCQALERTQLGLPLAPRRPRTMTHDYVRHGTITLFAALEQMTGK